MAAQMDDVALDAWSALPGKIAPGDVAALVSYLISPEAAQMTGQMLRLDRGMPF